MRIIAIANFKGGTGKTATACNLAALLARDGKRTLLIDADPQHNATSFFLEPDDDMITLYDVLTGMGEAAWSDNVQETGFENLSILPGDMNLLRLDLSAILSGSAHEGTRMLDFLECVRTDGETDFVLYDCPPSFTAATVSALMSCDEVIVPTRADAFSRAGALEQIGQVQNLHRRSISPRCRGLATRADRARLSKQAVEQLRVDGLDVFETVIHNSVCVSESSYARLPLYEYARHSRAAQDYEALLREVLADG